MAPASAAQNSKPNKRYRNLHIDGTFHPSIPEDVKDAERAMSILQVRCEYNGVSHFGVYEIQKVGACEKMNVRFDGEALEAELNGLPYQAVAETLLHELVVLKSIRETVDAGENRGRHGVGQGSTASEP